MPLDGYVTVISEEDVLIRPVDPEVFDYELHISHIRADKELVLPTYKPYGVLREAGQILGRIRKR